MEGEMVLPLHYSKNDTFCVTPKETAWEPPFAVMIDRGGGCSGVMKVRHAQRIGASAVIIANDKDGENIPALIDYGSGGDISIPSMTISKKDAHEIKATLKANQPVVAEMAWHWPKHVGEASIDFWHTPLHRNSAVFLSNFSKIALELGPNLTFTPHYHILDGVELHCHGNADSEGESCYDMCSNGGRYCAYGHEGISGKDVVIESLRRMCILKHSTGLKAWWAYLEHFTDWCLVSKDFFANPDCLSDAYKHSGLDKGLIEECMLDSGDVKEDAPNSLLGKEIADRKKDGIYQTPTVHINGFPLKWNVLNPKVVFDTYCTAFPYGRAPHSCYQCASCGDPVACISRSPMKCLPDDGKEKEEVPKKKKKHHFWRWFFFLSMIGGGGYYYYQNYVEDDDGDVRGRYSLADAFMSDSGAVISSV